MAVFRLPNRFWFTLVIIFLTVTARPSCKVTKASSRTVVCTAGDKDYVLRRGLVSDNNLTYSISLKDCRITGVQYESFENLPRVQFIDLSGNKISRMKLGVFDGIRQMKHLNLSHNLLNGFPLGSFDQLPNLETLDLRENNIQSENLPLGIFDPLKLLKHLDLSKNDIFVRDLDPYIFDQSRIIEYIDFSHNDMSGGSDILLHAFQALKELKLAKCSLAEIPKFATVSNMKTLKHISLSTNDIQKVEKESFKNFENLETLNLAENFIENLSEDVFKQLKKLKVIVLRKNKLKQIPEKIFENMQKLMNIDLSHNLIEYIPVSAFRRTILKNLNIANNRFTYLTPNFCLELRNSGARLMKFFFNQNPFQCSCLLDVVNEVNALKIEYNGDKYNGAEPICVTSGEFSCKRHLEFQETYVDLYDNLVMS